VNCRLSSAFHHAGPDNALPGKPVKTAFAEQGALLRYLSGKKAQPHGYGFFPAKDGTRVRKRTPCRKK
jgi:hypothetical protein